MNNILFGVIGLLLLGITGIGYAEVKTQLHAAEVASAAQDEESDTTREVSAANDVSASAKIATKETQKDDTPDTVPEVLGQVATRVEMALFDRWEDEDEGEYEDEDEEEDEDGDDERRSSKTAATTPQPSASASQTTSTNTQASGTASGITMTEVAKHNSATSCWTAVSGSVYDVTSFVSKHPGGQSAIKSMCGVDGTAAFSGQHSGQGKPESVLAQYKIGVVAQ